MIKNIFNYFILSFKDTFSATQRQINSNLSFSIKPFIICFTVCLAVLFHNYYAIHPGFKYLLQTLNSFGLPDFSMRLKDFMYSSSDIRLQFRIYWAIVLFLLYVVVPVCIIRFVFRERLADYGFKMGSVLKDYKAYLLMLVVMVPLVLYFSTTKAFLAKYPLYRPAYGHLFPGIFIWEFTYLVQFIGVEFLFRGFMLHGLKRYFGYYAIFVMMVPYCMVHFQKPMPEAISAIFAGIVLGNFSLKSGSIWLGVALHFTVALCMDAAALWHHGYF